MEKIRLHIDPKGVRAKPTDSEWASISQRIFQSTNAVSVTVQELAQKIREGHTVCPAVMDGSRAADWRGQQIFMTDIDNADETQPQLPIKQARAICKENGLPLAIYYQTFGYSNERQKYRLVFILDKPVINPQERQIIANALVALFPQSDKACVNANRIFLGTNKKVILNNENARISVEKILAVANYPCPQNTTPRKIAKRKCALTPNWTR